MQKNHDLTSKQLIEIVVVCVALGIGLLIHDYLETRINFDGTIKRSAAGTGNTTEDLELNFLDQNKELSVEVSDKSLSDKEISTKINEAIEEIEASYLRKNKSANEVCYDLNLKSSYCDGLIDAYWTFDKFGLISSDGKLRTEEIPEEGEVVNLVAQLSYEEQTELYSFSVFVCHKSINTLDGQLEAIEKAVKNVDSTTRDKDKMVLPTEVEDMKLSWKRKMDYRGLQVIILGLVTVLGIQLGKKKDEKKAKQLEIAEKEKDYPMIVSELSILMGAGMSLRKALERIISRYNQKKKSGIVRPGYEDISVTYRKMCDGLGEVAALEDLGMNSESKEYRKLAMLLAQNLRKGSADLISCLEKEEKYAFEMRKQRAIKAGEEASTKLLIPMAGMLFIVIVILVVPAIMQMNI